MTWPWATHRTRWHSKAPTDVCTESQTSIQRTGPSFPITRVPKRHLPLSRSSAQTGHGGLWRKKRCLVGSTYYVLGSARGACNASSVAHMATLKGAHPSAHFPDENTEPQGRSGWCLELHRCDCWAGTQSTTDKAISPGSLSPRSRTSEKECWPERHIYSKPDPQDPAKYQQQDREKSLPSESDTTGLTSQHSYLVAGDLHFTEPQFPHL